MVDALATDQIDEIPRQIPPNYYLIDNCCPVRMPGIHWVGLYGSSAEMSSCSIQLVRTQACIHIWNCPKLVGLFVIILDKIREHCLTHAVISVYSIYYANQEGKV